MCTVIYYVVSQAHRSVPLKRHLDRFSCFCTAHRKVSLYFTMSCPLSLKISLCMGGPGPHLHGSLDPPRSTSPTTSWSFQPFLQGSWLWQIDRPTDRPYYSSCNNRPHICSTVMQPKIQYAHAWKWGDNSNTWKLFSHCLSFSKFSTLISIKYFY